MSEPPSSEEPRGQSPASTSPSASAAGRRLAGSIVWSTTKHVLKTLNIPLGQWRAQLLLRFFGFVLLLLEGERVVRSVQRWDFQNPLASTVIGVVGLILLVLGPRLIALILSVGMSLYFLVEAVTQTRGHLALLADEYLLYFTIPFLTLLFGVVEWVRHIRSGTSVLEAARHGDVDDAIAVAFRIHLLVTLFFAGFHKFNTDFFNEKRTCMTLSRRLITWWSIPRVLIDLLAPWHIAVGEAVAPFVMLAAPRIGLVAVAFMVSGFGHIGPVAFASCCITLALAFLRRSDGAVLKRAYSRFGLLLLPASALLFVASYSVYDGNRAFFRFYVYQLFVLNVLFLFAALVAEDFRATRRAKEWGLSTWRALAFGFGPASIAPPAGPPAEVAPPTQGRIHGTLSVLNLPRLRPAELLIFPKAKAIQLIVALALVLHVVNGFSPYLGYKYRLSYAMLSNLRVDDYRWNHYIVPKAVRIYPRDGLMNIVKVSVPRADRKRAKEKKLNLRKGLAVGWHLEKVLRKYRRAGVHVDITIDDDGMNTKYVDAPFHPDLRRRLREDRTYGRMFQKNLRIKGSQGCVH